ncbi:hypothetical protein RI129_009300 [Pyrocoelia pectoralis]|uniref:TOG domain-containing protein n=1 Tax=Pyrocoelia pectoralis TaxID=417401 RepID=A0AAN7V5T1_9COLE
MSLNLKDEKLAEPRKMCYNLQSDDKRVRKQALMNLRTYLLTNEFTDEELQFIFNETHIYTLKALRDKTEAVRSEAINVMRCLILDKLPKNDYYLTYIFPVFVERIGTVELVEESEEIRLEMLQFMQTIIVKYSKTIHLKPFLNDCVSVLCETVKDKHPAIKELSCKCITQLAEALPDYFHTQAESLVKPVLTAFSYQRFKIRLEAVKCMGDIVMHSQYKALEEAAGPMAERLFDQIPAVRQMVVQVASHWLLHYRDRYSFFHKLLPLILTGLNDEVDETRDKAHGLWQIVGLQYERENESDLKDQMDYLTTLPKYYPENLTRPNLGCRALVQRTVCKIAPALARELSSWQGDVRVRCGQLLCAVALHAEDYLTQHLQDLLPAMYTAARDEDQRVVVNVLQASELIGLFVPVETWCKLILPAIEDAPHYGQLSVLSSLIKGAPRQYIKLHLEDICKLLAEDSICQSRKCKYQRELVKCVRAILLKCDQEKNELGEYIFRTIVTVISLRDSQNNDLFDFSLLEELQKSFGFLSISHIWSEYSPNLLRRINTDPISWTPVTVERCIFESFLLESGEAFGENLCEIGNILAKTLDTDADPESRLKTFVALSTALDSKDELLSQVLVPTLVWHAGRTAEAMRTMAVSCVCSVLNPGVGIDLFPEAASIKPFLDKLTPLLLSLTEDSSSRSRHLAIQALRLIKVIATKRKSWTTDILLTIYPEILKRLDDPNDSVRMTAVNALPVIFNDSPSEFKNRNYNGHHEHIIDTLITHFDDDQDYELQADLAECLKVMASIASKSTLTDKFYKHKKLMRNKVALEELFKEFIFIS